MDSGLAGEWGGARKVASRYRFSGGLWSNSARERGVELGCVNMLLGNMCGSVQLLVFEHNRATTAHGGSR
jgi:hypothetical protein